MDNTQILGSAGLNAWTDAKGFGPHFQPLKSWLAWMTVWKAIFSLEMSPDELALFQRCTGRTERFPGL